MEQERGREKGLEEGKEEGDGGGGGNAIWMKGVLKQCNWPVVLRGFHPFCNQAFPINKHLLINLLKPFTDTENNNN